MAPGLIKTGQIYLYHQMHVTDDYFHSEQMLLNPTPSPLFGFKSTSLHFTHTHRRKDCILSSKVLCLGTSRVDTRLSLGAAAALLMCRSRFTNHYSILSVPTEKSLCRKDPLSFFIDEFDPKPKQTHTYT